jgi:hypothetical protein
VKDGIRNTFQILDPSFISILVLILSFTSPNLRYKQSERIFDFVTDFSLCKVNVKFGGNTTTVYNAFQDGNYFVCFDAFNITY